MRRDLSWFIECADKLNGTVSISKDFIAHIDLYIDASLTGMGAYFDNNVYKVKFSEERTENIANLEALNIIMAIRTWGDKFRGRNVRVWCDNAAAVAVMNNGRGSNNIMQCIARNFWLWASVFDIPVEIQHINGEDNNIADLLSRWQQHGNLHAKLYALLNGSPIWTYPDLEFLELNYQI
jgi:hypothetical protein